MSVSDRPLAAAFSRSPAEAAVREQANRAYRHRGKGGIIATPPLQAETGLKLAVTLQSAVPLPTWD